ncbi:MAG TPA: HD domain-containing phosphohydrolase, partial [Tepidisphaeraceae bacterium]|nr:HD domain-containing phosphohydrolase [Tepidisphaeraceae bacterium]
TPSERDVIRSHPEMGCRYLQKMGEVPRVLEMVTRQHHERLDGSGYPDGLKGEQIPLVSRICGVVDSFDAMTAFRPYKERTMSVSQAVNLISSEAPVKYDATVVGAWIGMLRIAEKDGVLPEPLDISPPPGGANKNRRSNPRFAIGCPALAQVLPGSEAPGGEQPPQAVRAHSISRSGLGFLSPVRIRPGDSLRVQLMGGGTLERTVEGLTVRCREYRDGWYEVGMEFADLQTLAGSLAAEPN